MRYQEILDINNYRFDGTRFVVEPVKRNPIKSAIMGAVMMGLALSVTNLHISNNGVDSQNQIVEQVEQAEPQPSKKEEAFVRYIQSTNVSIGKDDAVKITSSILRWGPHFGVEPTLLLAMAKVESTFDKHAISPVGAMGILQVLPRWHVDKIKNAKEAVGSPEMFKIEPNVYVGAQVIRDCRDKHKDMAAALKCYNGSLGKKTTYALDVLREKAKIENYI